MENDDDLREQLEQLATYPLNAVHAVIYRVTLLERDPLASSLRGGRWIPPGTLAVLYTN